MDDRRTYRIAGVCSLASIAVFLIEFPFYLVRGAFPGVAAGERLIDFTARNATNILSCIFLDLLILGLLMVFLSGFRELIRRENSAQEWLGTVVFGVGQVYVTLTLVADSLQAATVVDALTPPPDATVIRAMLESMYLMYGSVALFLMAMMMGVSGCAAWARTRLPRWLAWLPWVCAAACLAFVPSMFAGRPDPTKFYNPAGWGPLAIAAGVPLAVWMVGVGIYMLKKPCDAQVD